MRDAGPVDLVAWLCAQPSPAGGAVVVPRPGSWTEAGLGARVAVLDRAVDLRHPDLADARITPWPGVPGAPGPAPDAGATARASVLVGQGRRDVLGLARDAHLLVADVLDVTVRGADQVVARAVRWAVSSGAQAVVLPFGRRRLGRLVASTLRWALDRGVVVLAAAGDLGPDALAFPAATAGVLAVTAHDDDGVLPGCAVTADVTAPGAAVPAAGPTGTTTIRGSGAATMVAAGAWAATRTAEQLAVVGARTGHAGGHPHRLVDA